MYRQDIGGQDVKVLRSAYFPRDHFGALRLIGFSFFFLLYCCKVMLDLSFMEAVQGCSKTVTFQTEVACNTCGMYIFL